MRWQMSRIFKECWAIDYSEGKLGKWIVIQRNGNFCLFLLFTKGNTS